MNEDFLARFRKAPRPEFAQSLYQRISHPVKIQRLLWRRRLLAASLLAFMLAMAALITSPRLRALARDVLRFFTPAQSEAFTLPTQSAASEQAPAATFAAPALAGCEEATAALSYRCVVGGAEAALGVDVRELPSDPDGFIFGGAFIDAAQGEVRLIYTRPGGELTIKQIRGAPAASPWESSWGAVPASSIERVQINGIEGEYVRGFFVVKSRTGTQAEWEPEAPVQRLRWQDGDFHFELQMGGLPGDNRAIGKEWLIALAESLK